jgi:hypothetical protein
MLRGERKGGCLECGLGHRASLGLRVRARRRSEL